MLEQRVKILSEGLARSMDRRKFLKQTGSILFAGMAALAAGHALGGTASAGSALPPKREISCAPPGPYCNTGGGELSGCHGGSCFQHLYQGKVIQCRVFYIYQAGCWTTYVSGGYWTCCDCECFQNNVRVTSCGCAQFSTNPVPRPDSPVSRADA